MNPEDTLSETSKSSEAENGESELQLPLGAEIINIAEIQRMNIDELNMYAKSDLDT